MSKRLSEADPRAIEREARSVPGVAFAELAREGERPVLRVVLWEGAPVEETAGLIELALRDALQIDVQVGDVRLAGTANLPAGSQEVRVIDLGGNTWATESVSGMMPALTLPEGLHGPAQPDRAARLVSVTVSRESDRCSARVEVDAGDGTRVGEASGPPSGVRIRRAVCEAAALAAATALVLAPLDVEHALVTPGEEPVAVVVIAQVHAGAVRRAAGACSLGADPWQAFALATLQAASSLGH